MSIIKKVRALASRGYHAARAVWIGWEIDRATSTAHQLLDIADALECRAENLAHLHRIAKRKARGQ